MPFFSCGPEAEGRIKVVSDKFISRAKACISSLDRPLPSRKTAREFPSNGREVNTSTCTISRGLLKDALRTETWDEGEPLKDAAKFSALTADIFTRGKAR